MKTLILCHHRRDEDELCDDDTVGMIATNCENLEHLYIRVSTTNSALKQISSLNQLKTLHISNRNTVINADNIEEMANNFKKLETFHVKCKSFDHIKALPGNAQRRIDEMKAAMKSFFQKQKTLKKFTFTCGEMFSLGFLEAIDICQELEHFNTGNAVSYPLNKAEIEALSRLPKLKSLTLRMSSEMFRMSSLFGIDVPVFDISSAFDSFMTNAFFEEMEYLDLSRNEDLTIENFGYLSERSFPKLITLDLDFCSNLKLNNGILTKLLSNAPRLRRLKLIDVEVGEVSEELFYRLQMKHILVHIKYNVPSSERPPSKSFIKSLSEEMEQHEDLFEDFY